MVLSAVRIRKRRRNEASSSETWAAPRSISATMPEKPANATAAARKASKRSGTEMVMKLPAALRPLPLDLDSAGFGARQGVQLFDADTRRLHAGIFETRDRDAFGQGLGEVDVACCQDGRSEERRVGK